MSSGILLVDIVAPNAGTIHPDDSVLKQVERAIPSAFTPAQVGDDIGLPYHQFDIAFDITTATTATVLASRTTPSLLEVGGLALTAQYTSTGADALAERIGILGSSEGTHQDLGTSSIESALGYKFLCDKRRAAKEAEDSKRRLVYGFAAGTLAVGLTFGALVFDSRNGRTDFTSHFTAILTGALWSKLSHLRQKKLKKSSVKSLEPAIEGNN